MSELSDKLGQVIAIFDPLFEIPNDGYVIDGKMYEQEPEIFLRKPRMEEVRQLAVEIRTLAIREGIDHLLPKSSPGATELGVPGGWNPAYTDEYLLGRAPKWIDKLRVAMGAADGNQVDDTDWPRQVDVAREAWPDEKKSVSKSRVARLIKTGDLKTNGKTGTDCRVDPASILAYCKREGLTYIRGK